jgi:hypothetical protein
MSIKLEVICKIFNDKYKTSKASNLNDVLALFNRLSDGIKKNDPTSSLLGIYLYENIASEEKRKRKASARDFEDFISYIFEGKVMDNDTRSNMPNSELKGINRTLGAYIASNRREKMDILFESGYGISVKTSMPDNKEINMGSFAREALFDGFLTSSEYGSERKGGLGSKPQMQETFLKIYKLKLWGEFCKRFRLMVDNIYVDDLVYVIKSGNSLELYFLNNSELRKILKDAIGNGPENAVSVINRYEGNSLRIERKQVMEKSVHIELDFSKLENTKISRILTHLSDLELKVVKAICCDADLDLSKTLDEDMSKIISEVKN